MEKEEENYFNSDFQHGYSMGMENAYQEKVEDETAPYEGYLSSQVSYEWLHDRLSEKRAEVAKIDAEIEQIKTNRKTTFDKLQEFTLGEQVYIQKCNLANKEFEANALKISQLEAKKQKNETPYSLFSGILYFLAGIAFVTGDLIISHEIVAYALNIRNNIEAWSFAVGLAMLSVLLKPAYERLVEQPYLTDYNAKTKRIYGIFQGFLLVFSIGTMLVLGWFRYEAYKTDKLKEGINKQIKSIQLNAQPLDALGGGQAENNQALIQQLDEKMKIYDKLNLDLVNSPWALLSFILSGVLFAIAGAICLGIAFPVLHAYWYRWLQASPALKKAQKTHIRLKEALQLAEKELADQTIQKNILQNELENFLNIEDLKTEKKSYLIEIEHLLNDIKQFDIDRRIHTFTDGYEKGMSNRSQMSDDEYEDFRSASLKRMKNVQDTRNEPNQKVLRNNGLSPHVALRKAITRQVNDN
jgi:hypothetical protein